MAPKGSEWLLRGPKGSEWLLRDPNGSYGSLEEIEKSEMDDFFKHSSNYVSTNPFDAE